MPADDRIWYVAYGSNLCAGRIRMYVEGGRYPGHRRAHPGCRDATAPEADGAVAFSGVLYFARAGGGWTDDAENPPSGSAYVAEAAEGQVLGRRWLLAREQFVDVLLQENDEDPLRPRTPVDLRSLLADGGGVVPTNGPYPRVVRLEDVEGRPALTFTAREDRRAESLPPSEVYVKTIAAGIFETYPNLEVGAVVDYLTACSGVGGRIESVRLVTWVQSVRSETGL